MTVCRLEGDDLVLAGEATGDEPLRLLEPFEVAVVPGSLVPDRGATARGAP